MSIFNSWSFNYGAIEEHYNNSKCLYQQTLGVALCRNHIYSILIQIPYFSIHNKSYIFIKTSCVLFFDFGNKLLLSDIARMAVPLSPRSTNNTNISKSFQNCSLSGELVNFQILCQSTNLGSLTEKRYDKGLTIRELKGKLELITGKPNTTQLILNLFRMLASFYEALVGISKGREALQHGRR